MANEKETERNQDNITLKKLKYIIILCSVACIICEFVPDILKSCKWFEFCSLFDLLQHHKDFFTNIALGCLGSAVISYLMLSIQYRIRENEKMASLDIYLKDVISKYWYLIIALMYSYEIKNENKDLQMAIGKFMNYYEEIAVYNKYLIEFVDIFSNKLIPLADEVELFMNSFCSLVNKKEIERLYSQEVYLGAVKEIYKNFYKLLSEEFQLQKIDEKFNKKFNKISFINGCLIEELEKNLQIVNDFSSKRKEISDSVKYSKMIEKSVGSKNLDKIKDEISE